MLIGVFSSIFRTSFKTCILKISWNHQYQLEYHVGDSHYLSHFLFFFFLINSHYLLEMLDFRHYIHIRFHNEFVWKTINSNFKLEAKRNREKKRVISPSMCLEKRKFLHAHLNCRRWVQHTNRVHNIWTEDNFLKFYIIV